MILVAGSPRKTRQIHIKTNRIHADKNSTRPQKQFCSKLKSMNTRQFILAIADGLQQGNLYILNIKHYPYYYPKIPKRQDLPEFLPGNTKS
jgi:hypothetical protein